MTDTYFFVDGSSLLGDIARLWKQKPFLENRKLVLTKLCSHFTSQTYANFIGDGYRRFTIYFVNGEDRLKEMVIQPDFSIPEAVEDFHISSCGKRLRGSKKIQDWLSTHSAPESVLERFNKSEKAVDTQICCDALQLAANNRLDRLFVYTNDYDFLPLFSTLKAMGSNISLFRLTKASVNKDLAKNADSFHVPPEAALDTMFEPVDA